MIRKSKRTKIEKEVDSLIDFMKRLKTYDNKKAFEKYMKRKEIVLRNTFWYRTMWKMAQNRARNGYATLWLGHRRI